MAFYLLMIIFGNIIIFSVGFFFLPYSGITWWMNIILPIFHTLIIFFSAALVSLIIRKLPEKWFSKEKQFWPSKKEKLLYEKLGIKKWKDHILEVGGIANGLSKAHVGDINDIVHLNRFILESTYGVVMHFVSIFMGILLIFIFPFSSFYWNLFYAIPVLVVNAFLHLLPLMVLRYNLPRINALKIRAERKATEK